MYYLIEDGTDYTDAEAHEMFDDELDCDGNVTVLGMEYQPSRVLREVDPIAYRCSFSDWTSDVFVEHGYFVRVITEDGEIHTEPAWYVDEDEARDAYSDIVEALGEDGETGLVVGLYDTTDTILAEDVI